jgi:hypothetical protein
MARKPAQDRTCHCGHRRGDPAIQEEPEYGFIGWILLSIFGLTPRPDWISFRCRYCREELGTSRDPKLLARRSTPKDVKAKPATTPTS